jgi:hypothetical protein
MIVRFSGRFLVQVGCALVGITAFGCKSATPGSTTGIEGSAPPVTVGDPPPLKDPQLYLLSEGKKIQLGESLDDALRVFEPPKSAFELGQLPPNFQPPYRAIGWETAQQGFGAIGFNTKLVLIMWQIERGDLAQYAKILQLYQDQFPAIQPVEISNRIVRYNFYEVGEESLMILAVPNKGGTFHITVALGLNPTMAAIGANPEQARKIISDEKIKTQLLPGETP